MFPICFIMLIVGTTYFLDGCNPDTNPYCVPKYHHIGPAVPVANHTATTYRRVCTHWHTVVSNGHTQHDYCSGYGMKAELHSVIEFRDARRDGVSCNLTDPPEYLDVHWDDPSARSNILRRGDGACIAAPTHHEVMIANVGGGLLGFVGCLYIACVALALVEWFVKGPNGDASGALVAFCVPLFIAGGVLFSQGCDSVLKPWCTEGRDTAILNAPPMQSFVEVTSRDTVCTQWIDRYVEWVCNETVKVPTAERYRVLYGGRDPCNVTVDGPATMAYLMDAGPTTVYPSGNGHCFLEPPWVDVYRARVGFTLLLAAAFTCVVGCAHGMNLHKKEGAPSPPAYV